MDIFKEALAIEAQVIAWQEHFHENAELSQKEEHTVEVILEHLNKLGIACVNVPDGGVLGFIRGKKPGKTVLLRADIDALDMEEAPRNDKFPKKVLSKYPGVAHTCGHDAHTAMLMGAAQILKAHESELEGNIVLYFERGEEHGEGDLHLMGYIQENNIHVDGAWGLHMRPNLPAGTIGTREGGINAASCIWFIKLEKMEGNPFTMADCAVGVIHNLNTARMREVSPYESLTITPCKVQINEETCIVSGSCRFNEREKVGFPIHDVLKYGVAATVAYALGFLAHKEPIEFTPFVGTIKEFYASLNV